tara:strand:+ start:93 stop:989 length:897 start_codon:yes stop_codon:yes gene_type:complete
MSITLKRPMFRKGGEVMEGIMTGIKPRESFAEKAISDDLKSDLGRIQQRVNLIDAISGAGSSPLSNPLTQFLLQTGQNLISGESAGGTKLQEIVGATRDPLKRAVAAQERRDLSRRKLTASLIGKLGTGSAEQAYRSYGQFLTNPDTGKKYTLNEFRPIFGTKELYRKGDSPAKIERDKDKAIMDDLSKIKDFAKNQKYSYLEKQSVKKAIKELEKRPGLLKITSKAQDVFVQGKDYDVLEPIPKTRKTGEKIKLKQLKSKKPGDFETGEVYYLIEEDDFFIFDGVNFTQVPPPLAKK